MIPILKKGKNKSKASSYRPISLTSSCCKLLERIINKHMHMNLESENIIGNEHAGFRQYKSTEDQTTHPSQVVEDAFQSKKVTFAVFVDLHRAFDKLWKDELLAKMLREKTTGTLFTLSPKTQSIKLIVDDTPTKMEDQHTYLGVTFDQRMTWKQHITSAEATAKRKLNIMRKRAGTKS
ncbi:unnamed protein product [Mytilus coruscus]|uniref:Reverse transcriptase domain-containing protein n=1 Tax=Mytilus coruscus TaxID=42192 RepID=A0A6J8D5U5_MYTCO|nr:unnamed protein product [Mytilus coruscus]